MATVFANVMGVRFDDSPLGPNNGGLAVLTIKVPGAFVAGTDLLQLGGGGFDNGAATTATLAALIATHRRDGKVITLLNAYGYAPGLQAASAGAVPTAFFAQAGTVAGANLTFANLFTAATAGTGVSATALGVNDRAIQLEVGYTAV